MLRKRCPCPTLGACQRRLHSNRRIHVEPGGQMSLIALEEHYAWDPASADNIVAAWLRSNNHVAYERLYDRGPLRLEQMDAAGIDFQILSLFDPGVQTETDIACAIDLARRANDDLAETVR